MPGSRRGECACRDLEGHDALSLNLELVDLLKGHTVVGELGDLVLEPTQPYAWRLGLLAVGRPLDLPIVRDTKEQPPAFCPTQVRLVAECREVLTDVLEVVVLLGSLVFDHLGLHISDETQGQRGHLAQLPYHGTPN